MSDELLRQVKSFVGSMKGLRCWYVSCGGAVGPTFQLALGEKVRRLATLRNRAHSEEFRQYEGEANLLVWCTWRLDGPNGPLTSSDDTSENVHANLLRLDGATVQAVSVANQAGDLNVSFRKGLKLRVFCDHVPPSPSFDGNWELWRTDRTLVVGPGHRFEFAPRQESPGNEALAGQSHSLTE